MSAKRYLELFFEEKELEPRIFTVEHNETVHMIESALLQDLIINHTSASEQGQIRAILVKIDFYNGDVNHFLEHLAQGYVMSHF
ncbi:hypothetical protein [Paenibacillus lautus]|uniref:hypothetical protein n=1 Tax=Paenibacillus lautus TaxID=1401 RepID=UPI002DBA3E75|nr:hypothetical protein [Paenibacillus lautus]MEC0259352.1 hypothetical protein [Paenibacillus lautus]